jgi:hypothetical protein
VPATSHSLIRRSRRVLVGAATAALAFTFAAPVLTSAPAAVLAKPGLSGSAFTVASQISFDGDNRAYDVATDKAGNTYLGWISSAANSSTPRQIHLCTLPLHATGCKGGVQTINSTDSSTASGIRVLSTPSGAVTILWYHSGLGVGEISEATSQSGGPLSSQTDVQSAPANGYLLDAEYGPGGSIWTVATGSSSAPLEVTAGIPGSATTVKTPYAVGFARLAFSGSTPIIAITKEAQITDPAAFTYRNGSSWTKFKNVAGTWTVGTNVGLTHTSHGVFLSTYVGNANYFPVVAKWNGHGFSHRRLTGDRDNCHATSQAPYTDASGRLANVGIECSKVAVSNIADGHHDGIFRFPVGGTPAGGAPQIATLPRGFGWVVWSVQYSPSSSAEGDKLRVVPVRLSDPHQSVKKHGSHGTITVTGPASCLPAISISVSVSGHPASGWRVTKRHLSLGGKTVHKTLNGASLTPGKKYSLKGKVTFASGGSHQTLKAAVKFKACPLP